MTVATLLADLRAKGVSVAVDGADLVCRAPKGAITPAVRQALTERKAEVITWLTSKCDFCGRYLHSHPRCSRCGVGVGRGHFSQGVDAAGLCELCTPPEPPEEGQDADEQAEAASS